MDFFSLPSFGIALAFSVLPISSLHPQPFSFLLSCEQLRSSPKGSPCHRFLLLAKLIPHGFQHQHSDGSPKPTEFSSQSGLTLPGRGCSPLAIPRISFKCHLFFSSLSNFSETKLDLPPPCAHSPTYVSF